MDDHQLLAQFAAENSEAAFTTLVARHVNLVYATAHRHTGQSHAAEEISQAVFIILARKAPSLSPKVILAGWLYNTTRLTAGNYLRTERRRQQREQEAYMQSLSNEMNPAADATWTQIAPLLDDALAKLGDRDRDALVLRFFENKSAREIATALRVEEATAHKRVTRAIEKLRKFFAKRGVTISATAIAGTVSANSVQAAPVALVKIISAVAVAKGTAATTSTLTLVKGALKLMAWTKAKTAIVAGVVVLLAAGTTTVTIKEIQKYRASAWETEYFNTNIVSVLNKMPPLVEILPTKYLQSKDWAYSGGVLDQKMVGVCKTLKDILYDANTTDFTDLPSDRLIFPDNLPTNKYDFVVNRPTGAGQALREKIAEQFGLALKIEVRETNVLWLQVASRNALGLKPHKGNPTMPGWYMVKGTNVFNWDNMSLPKLANFLEMYLAVPVIDRTGLSGRFDIKLKLEMDEFPASWSDHSIDDFRPALLNQLGLELVPTNMPIEMLVVERAP